MNFRLKIEQFTIEWEDGTTITMGQAELLRIYKFITDPKAVAMSLGPIIGQQAIERPTQKEQSIWAPKPADPPPLFGESDAQYLARVKRLRRKRTARQQGKEQP